MLRTIHLPSMRRSVCMCVCLCLCARDLCCLVCWLLRWCEFCLTHSTTLRYDSHSKSHAAYWHRRYVFVFIPWSSRAVCELYRILPHKHVVQDVSPYRAGQLICIMWFCSQHWRMNDDVMFWHFLWVFVFLSNRHAHAACRNRRTVSRSRTLSDAVNGGKYLLIIMLCELKSKTSY